MPSTAFPQRDRRRFEEAVQEGRVGCANVDLWGWVLEFLRLIERARTRSRPGALTQKDRPRLRNELLSVEVKCRWPDEQALPR